MRYFLIALVLCGQVFAETTTSSAGDLFLQTNEFLPDVVRWEGSREEKIVFGAGGEAYVVFRGELAEGYRIALDGHPVVSAADGSFEMKVSLPRDPGLFSVDIEGGGKIVAHEFTFQWTQPELPKSGTYPVKDWADFSWIQISRPRFISTWYGHVRLSSLLIVVDGGATSFSPEMSWNPVLWRFSSGIAVVGNLGLTVYKGDRSKHAVFETAAFMAFPLKSLLFEIGPEIQTWTSRGTHFAVTAQLDYALTYPLWGFLDKLFVGYTHLWDRRNAEEFRLGLEFVL